MDQEISTVVVFIRPNANSTLSFFVDDLLKSGKGRVIKYTATDNDIINCEKIKPFSTLTKICLDDDKRIRIAAETAGCICFSTDDITAMYNKDCNYKYIYRLMEKIKKLKKRIGINFYDIFKFKEKN